MCMLTPTQITHMCAHKYTHTYTHTQITPPPPTHTHTHKWHTQPHTHTQIHPHTHTKIHSTAHTHTHTNTNTPVLHTVWITVIILLYQVAIRFRRQGHHIVQDHTTVTAGCQNQLIVEMVKSHAPNPVQIPKLSEAQLTYKRKEIYAKNTCKHRLCVCLHIYMYMNGMC